MDLSKLNTVAGSEQGFELELLHPTTLAPLGVFINVLGRDSAAFRDLQNQQSRKRLGRAQKLGLTRSNISLEDIEKDAIDLLAACTRTWRTVEKDEDQKPVEKPIVLVNGEELACNRANAVRLYNEWPWVKEQVDEAVTNRANFLPR